MGASSVDPDTIPPRRSTVAPFLQPALNASSAVWPAASSHRQAFLFSRSRNATGFDQDDAAGLAAERALDYHLLEKSMSLMVLEVYKRMHPSSARRIYPRAWKPRSTCSSLPA